VWSFCISNSEPVTVTAHSSYVSLTCGTYNFQHLSSKDGDVKLLQTCGSVVTWR